MSIHNQIPRTCHSRGKAHQDNSAIEPILSYSSHNWQKCSSGKGFKPPRNSCEFCGGDFRLNVVSDRHTSRKFLKAGCCDAFIRICPEPDELRRSPHITNDEREYLQGVATLDWFGGSVASVLIALEAKAQGGEA